MNNNIVNNFVSVINSYTFKLKGTTSTVPATDICGNQIINTGSTLVTMYNDATRGYVFNFTGVNTLTINVNTPIVCTRTFWISIPSTTSSGSYVYQSDNFQFILDNNVMAVYTRKVSDGTDLRISCSFTQGAQWVFYAVTRTSTNVSVYVNGSSVADTTGSVVGILDTSTIRFGGWGTNGPTTTGHMDDLRQYSSVLTADQIKAIYNGA